MARKRPGGGVGVPSIIVKNKETVPDSEARKIVQRMFEQAEFKREPNPQKMRGRERKR